jgi:hypothetical protein
LNLQQRLRETRIEALVRSVGRSNGKQGFVYRYFRRKARRDDFAMDFRDRGEDVWGALRF